MRYVFFFAGLMILFPGCGRQPIEQFATIIDRTWDYNHPENFVISISRPGTYKMQVQVRYTQEYSYSNVWVALNEKSPDGKTASMRLNIPLFDLSGNPYGTFAGKFYDRSYPDAGLESKELTLNFPSSGKYEFSIQHNMRIDKLDGIDEIGVRLKPAP